MAIYLEPISYHTVTTPIIFVTIFPMNHPTVQFIHFSRHTLYKRRYAHLCTTTLLINPAPSIVVVLSSRMRFGNVVPIV